MPVATTSARRTIMMMVVVIWLTVGVQWLVWLPRFGKVFREFGLLLPWYSEALLQTYGWLFRYVWLVGWFYLMAIFLSMIRVRRLMQQDCTNRHRNIQLSIVFFIPLLFFLWACLGLVIPYIKLMAGLNH